tara:strand:- start:935 stop:1831 length:897 start_codon:yes stop_codon:yes gene_type:complete
MAITFKGLGNEGRLGNQMFQYAFVRGVADNRGFEWFVPGPDADRLDNYGLFDCFELTNCDLEKNIGEYFIANRVEYRDMHFNEQIFNECSDDSDFSGNFQTERYFEKITASIREDFTFKESYLTPCQDYIDSLGGREGCIFLHVRRGSPNLTGRRGEKWSYQMVQEYHPLCKKEYYLEALKEFPEDKNIIVVSDTIDWCKEQPWLQGDRFHFSDSSYEEFGDGASVPYIDLCLMSLCGGAIIANSSLSWWGAWLQNNTGKVVVPDPWFGSAYAHYDMKDMIPKRWVKLHNDPTPVTPE